MFAKTLLLIVFTALALQSDCGFAQQADGPGLSVSLVRVIANPMDFNGKRLRLTGYLGGNGPDRSLGLYLSGIDGRNAIFPNSIGLNIEESKVRGLLGEYVVLTAIFHAPDPRFGLNGYLDQATDIRKWPPIPPK